MLRVTCRGSNQIGATSVGEAVTSDIYWGV